jgi:hypothetical protein
MSILVVAEVQDALLVVMNDLQRLESLINHASTNLLDRFGQAIQGLAGVTAEGGPGLTMAREALQMAVTELQFQDMSSQLIIHTTKILRACSHQLAAESMGLDEDEDAEVGEAIAVVQPERPNPVTQSEMDAGSIELF